MKYLFSALVFCLSIPVDAVQAKSPASQPEATPTPETAPTKGWYRHPIFEGEMPTTSGPDQQSFYDVAGCFHKLDAKDRDLWMPSPLLTAGDCQALDSCSEHGGGLSQGQCHKWTKHSQDPQVNWTEPLVAYVTPPTLIFDRKSVKKDELLRYAEHAYQPLGPLRVIKSVRPNGVHGHAAYVSQEFSDDVRFEHIPMDIDGNGAVTSHLILPDMPTEEVKELIESLAVNVLQAAEKRFWQGTTYFLIAAPGECSFSYEQSKGRLTIRFECASC